MAGKVEVVRELDAPQEGQTRVLVRQGENFYVISPIPKAFDTRQPETLAFPADADGNVVEWGDVAGGIEMTREQTIAELETNGPVDYQERPASPFQKFLEDPEAMIQNTLEAIALNEAGDGVVHGRDESEVE